jgi:hypothetical protein
MIVLIPRAQWETTVIAPPIFLQTLSPAFSHLTS